jgi:hypothetical protein
LPHAIPSRKHPGKHTNSEHDWAWILHELAHGKDAAKLTRTIAFRPSDNPKPLYCAQRTVDAESARGCLIEGVPMEDVVTLLVVRCRSEITSVLRIREGPSKNAAESPSKKPAAGWSPRLLYRYRRRDPAFNFVAMRKRCFAPEEC